MAYGSEEMSNYVYIALEGLRRSPISEEAWLTAVRQCDELIVDTCNSSRSDKHVVRLKTDRRATVRLDRFGIAGAAAPSRELIGAMFKVAAVLNANVYSEHFNKYSSTDDWSQRRKQHRRVLDKQRAYKDARKQKLLQLGVWCAVCAAAALSGFLLGTFFVSLGN